jgi:hypothetical protein
MLRLLTLGSLYAQGLGGRVPRSASQRAGAIVRPAACRVLKRLYEPFDLPPNTRLIVTVLPPMTDTDREDWSNLSVANLARAYGDDEPE